MEYRFLQWFSLSDDGAMFNQEYPYVKRSNYKKENREGGYMVGRLGSTFHKNSIVSHKDCYRVKLVPTRDSQTQ